MWLSDYWLVNISLLSSNKCVLQISLVLLMMYITIQFFSTIKIIKLHHYNYSIPKLLKYDIIGIYVMYNSLNHQSKIQSLLRHVVQTVSISTISYTGSSSPASPSRGLYGATGGILQDPFFMWSYI